MKASLSSFKTAFRALLPAILLCMATAARSQNVCNASGNLMLFTNYDGGTLTINVNQNIPNLKIGICSYEACYITLTGAFVGNVTGVRYAGYNGTNNTSCGSPSIPTTTIIGAPVSAAVSTVFAPAATYSNSFGYGSIICGYSCSNNTNQGGCNTVDQVEAYFLNYFSGSTLFAHKVQYGCWTGTQSVSIGGTCCPPIPVVPGVVAASQSICAGQTPALFTSSVAATGGSGTITYTWQSSTTSTNSGFSNIASTNSATYAPGALFTTTYYRRAASTSSNNVAYSNVLTVTVVPYPSVSISGQTMVCMGSTSTLVASGGTAYTWLPSNTSGPSLVITPTASTTFTLICPPGGACVTTITIPVSLAPLPAITAPAPSPVCQGQSVAVIPTGGVNYTLVPSSAIGSTLIVTPPSSGVYTVIGVNASGCTGSATTALSVMALPAVAASVANTVVCSGQSASLTGSGASTYVWEPGNINANPLVTAPAGPATYTVNGTDANGCTGSATIALSVAPLPTVVITPGVSTICSGKTTTFSASGAINYTWMPGNLTGNTVTVSPGISTTYTITGDDGCTNLVTQLLTVDPSPSITVAASRTLICRSESATLTPSGASTYTWSGLVTPVTGIAVVNPTASAVYTVGGTGTNGCEGAKVFSLTVAICSGLSENGREAGLEVFPNPSRGELTIQGKTAERIRIMDSQGRQVGAYELNSKNGYRVSVSDLAAGVYFVVTGGGARTQKIIVTK